MEDIPYVDPNRLVPFSILRYILLTIILAYFLFFASLLFYWRKKPFFQARYETLQHFINLFYIGFIIEHLLVYTPCWVWDWSVFMVIEVFLIDLTKNSNLESMLMGDRVVVRAYLLIARFGIQKRLLQNRKEEEFTRFQRFFSDKAALAFFIIGIIINSTSFLIISLNLEDYKEYYSLEVVTKYICLYKRQITSRTIPFFVIYDLLIITAVIIMQKQKVKENLTFKVELILNAVLMNLAAIFSIPAYASKDPDNFITLSTTVVVVLQFSVMTVLPIYRNYKQEKLINTSSSSYSEISGVTENEVSPIARYFGGIGDLDEFKKFLLLEFSLENLLFIQEVAEFRKKEDLARAAQGIMKRYVGANSRTPVNISGQVLDKIFRDISEKNFTIDMFDAAFDEILQLLKNDSFRRFKRTRLALGA